MTRNAGAFRFITGAVILLTAFGPQVGKDAPAPLNIEVSEADSGKALTPYEQAVASVYQARRHGKARLYVTGKSVEGRPIYLAAVTPSDSFKLPSRRVMVICGQHGDEPFSTLAVSELVCAISSPDKIRKLASASGRFPPYLSSILDDVLWIIIPAANPDGLERRTRENAAGVDLNRDWQRATQPETQAIRKAFDRWKPHIVLDLHQWSMNDPAHTRDGIEGGRVGMSSAASVLEGELTASALAKYRRKGPSVSTVNTAFVTGNPELMNTGPNSHPGLAHRYFASRGAAGFLVESSALATPLQRRIWFTEIVVNISRLAASAPRQRFDSMAFQRDFSYPPDFKDWMQARAPKPHRSTEPEAGWQPLAACAFCLTCLWLFQKRADSPGASAQAAARIKSVRLIRKSGIRDLSGGPCRSKFQTDRIKSVTLHRLKNEKSAQISRENFPDF